MASDAMSEKNQDVQNATYFLMVWYDELMRKNWYTSMTKGMTDPYVDGTVTKSGKNKVKVKLSNGTEVTAKAGSYTSIRTNAWVLLLKHFRKSGTIGGVPNYVVGSYEVIGVRYRNSDGTVTKIYRN